MSGIMSGVRPRVSHTEFGRCSTPGLGQIPKCFIAALCAFNDLASDVAASLMSLAGHPEDLTCPFKGDFHIGEGARTKSICDHGHLLSVRGTIIPRGPCPVCSVSDSGTKLIPQNQAFSPV
jgi:hypothetical protein